MTLHRVMETGQYTGNGTSQAVALGWQPAFVFTFSEKSGGNPNQRGGCFKTRAGMSGSNSIRSRQGVAYSSDTVTITATGFTVGADDSANRNGEVYNYFAVREANNLDEAGYTGTNPTDSVFVLNRQPLWLMHANIGAAPHIAIKHPDQATDAYWEFATSAGIMNGLTINSDGFTASGADANTSGTSLIYAALYNLVGANRHWESGTYTGDGAATQAVTLGRQPKIVMIQDAATNRAVFKFDTMGGSGAAVIESSTDYLSSYVSLISTGFQVNTTINTSGVSFRWLAGFF